MEANVQMTPRQENYSNVKPSWQILDFDENVPKFSESVKARMTVRKQAVLYEAVIGECFVFRKFQQDAKILDFKETSRYVFWEDCIYVETKERNIKSYTMEEVTEELMVEDVYDAWSWIDEFTRNSIYQAFFRDVKIANKKEITKGFLLVSRECCLKIFVEIYRKIRDTRGVDENVPKRIIHELHNRSHKSYSAVRIQRDLVVVTTQVFIRNLDRGETIRAYFDKDKSYFFRQNNLTEKWYSIDAYSFLIDNQWNRKIVYDKDLFDGTCMEKFAKYSVNDVFPSGDKITYGVMLAQAYFLCAEQAAKIGSNATGIIIENIYEQTIVDPSLTLAEIFGITGAQLKFLNNIILPKSLKGFAECMQAEDFKEHFPDVKKRLFAVAFYLKRRSIWGDYMEIDKEEIFEAAKTLNSLEKSKSDKLDMLLEYYYDYIIMWRNYKRYEDEISEDNPAYQAIVALGNVSVNVKPSKIIDVHNKLLNVLSVLQDVSRIKKYQKAIAERKAMDAQKFEYTDGQYSILLPKDAADILREGCELNHCVGSAGYMEVMAAGYCTILFLRNNQEIDKAFFTIEVNGGCINQCYGYCNCLNEDEKVRDFIKKYADEHQFTIDATIYKEKSEKNKKI